MNTISGSQLVVADVHLRDLTGGLDAGQARHADVEEHQVGAVFGHQRHRLGAVPGLGDDLELGPDLGQPRAQLLAHQAFVVGDHAADHVRPHACIVAEGDGVPSCAVGAVV